MAVVVEAAFYGDDFTGSTDAMVQFARVGLRSVLLVTLPSAPELRALAERYDVIGVAGVARSLPPDEQEAELRPVLEALRDLRPRLLQYKVCSTADSSPTRGSIGRALEIGREVCGPAVVPILIAQPELGRYTVFSHHFAAEAGTIHRLDRQPTMSTHPATPMHESDLRRHLAHQTSLPLTALHLTDYPTLPASLTAGSDASAVLLDALTDEDLLALGQVIVREAASGEVRFVIGSGGMSRAIGSALQPGAGAVTPATSGVTHAVPSDADGVAGATSAPAEGVAGAALSNVGGPVLVVAGSQSRRTAEQIAYARSAGWAVLPLADGVAAEAMAAFAAGADGVVVHTNELDPEDIERVPAALAEVVCSVTAATAVRRVVVAGGDTSGQVLRQLGISALELAGPAQPVAPGVHLCRAAAAAPGLDGLEVLLKPGQLGEVDLFTQFRRRSG